MILAALVQRNDVAAQAGLVGRFLLDLRHHGATGDKRLLGGHVGFDSGVDPVGDVFDAHQDVQLEVKAAFLFAGRPGVKAVAEIIMILVAEFLQGVRADVMV